MALTWDKPLFFWLGIAMILIGLIHFSINLNSVNYSLTSIGVLSSFLTIAIGTGTLIKHFITRKKFYKKEELKEMILVGFKNMRLFSLKTFILVVVFLFLLSLVSKNFIGNQEDDFNLANQKFIKKHEDYLTFKMNQEYKNLTECELHGDRYSLKLDSTNFKNICYLVSAYYVGDPGICEKISLESTNGYMKNTCYLIMATETLNKDLCYKIPSNEGSTALFQRELCLERMADFQGA